jgi:hypothetical protein
MGDNDPAVLIRRDNGTSQSAPIDLAKLERQNQMNTNRQIECKLNDNLETLELILMDDPVLGDEFARMRQIYPEAPVNMIIRVDPQAYDAMLAEAEEKARRDKVVMLVAPTSESPTESDRYAHMEQDIRAGNLSYGAIANKYRVGHNTVSGAARAMGITKRARSRATSPSLTKEYIERIREHYDRNPQKSPLQVAQYFHEPYDKIVRVLTGEMGVGGKYVRACDRAKRSPR